MKRVPDLRDESGLTMVELLVATLAGVFVMGAITLAMLTTIRETGRVTSHVEANQRARITMTKILKQLHSACVAPQIVPIKKESSETVLSFIHQTGEEVAPVPIKSNIYLEGTTLKQDDFQVVGGAAPNWKFSETASSTEELMKGVGPISESVPLFSYYSYSNGSISASPLPTPLSQRSAELAVQVSIAFETTPEPPIQEDENSATEIQNSALLRLTPPAYSSATDNLPCQ